MSVKLYRNTTDEDIFVFGIDLIPAHEQVSVSSDYQPHVVMENYPGLVEVSDEPGPDEEGETNENN